MTLPVRITRAPAAPAPYPAQQPRPDPPTPTSIEAESSGRSLRPLQEVARKRRQPGRSEVQPFGPVDVAAMRLPFRLG